MPYADRLFGSSTSAQYTGAGTNYVIETPTKALYFVYIDRSLNDVVFKKSTDGGFTWSELTNLYNGSVTNLAVWYDRWSNIAAGLIHVVWTESGTDDTHYRTINTESSDDLSNDVVIFAGTSTASGGHLSVTRARGGNVYCKTVIDAGAEGDFFRLTNANVPNGAWDNRAVDEAIATQDQMILVPGFAADNNDIMAIFWDSSSDEISRKIYDDSADSWAEASIATSMVDSAATSTFPNFYAAVDLTNSQIILVAWSAVATSTADLRCWTITESAITETATNVVLNSGGNQMIANIGINLDTGYWHVFYYGKSDGSETASSLLNLYTKVSTDAGATWSAETKLSAVTQLRQSLWCCPRFTGDIKVIGNLEQTGQFLCFALRTTHSRANFQLGL